MGYYIQTDYNHGKAQEIAEKYNGVLLASAPKTYEDIPAGKALIAVVNNGAFEAAGFCYDASEFACFTDPRDSRSCRYVLIDRDTAEILSGYKE
jgi:hypothetical protein